MVAKLIPLGVAALAWAIATNLGQQGQPPHAPGQNSEVGAMFKKNCASCHIPPDLRFKPDKAWLGQIRETA